MQKMIPVLTERQRFWLEHIRACEASGKSMAEYATEHGVKVRAMYSGRKILVNKGVLPSEQQNRFQRVQVMETSINQQWRIGLVDRKYKPPLLYFIKVSVTVDRVAIWSFNP